jgi:hypothetical protein
MISGKWCPEYAGVLHMSMRQAGCVLLPPLTWLWYAFWLACFFSVAVADQQLPLSVVENVCGRRLRELATCMQALLIYFTRKQRRPTQCDANKRVITRFTRKIISDLSFGKSKAGTAGAYAMRATCRLFLGKLVPASARC